MSDHFEKFVKENRAAFDDKEAPDIWSKIERELPKKPAKRIKLTRILRQAAAVVILLIIGGLGGQYLSSSNSNQMADNLEVQEMITFYNQKVSKRKAKLASYNLDPIVNVDIQQLDQVIAELEEELSTIPKGSEEKVINAIIQNYQTKVALLERILERIESKQLIKKENDNEKVNI